MELKCKFHPQYRAIRRPRQLCQRCWAIYDQKQEDEKYDKEKQVAKAR